DLALPKLSACAASNPYAEMLSLSKRIPSYGEEAALDPCISLQTKSPVACHPECRPRFAKQNGTQRRISAFRNRLTQVSAGLARAQLLAAPPSSTCRRPERSS